MAFKEIGGMPEAPKTSETMYPKLADVAPGTVLAEGIYTGSHDGQFGKTFYIAQSNGIAVGLNSWGKLNYLINQAGLTENKSLVRITYLGKKVIEEGSFAGKEAHDFKLEVDSDSVSLSAVNS